MKAKYGPDWSRVTKACHTKVPKAPLSACEKGPLGPCCYTQAIPPENVKAKERTFNGPRLFLKR